MEAILKFNLPEDHIEFEMAVNGSKMHSVLWEMDQLVKLLRSEEGKEIQLEIRRYSQPGSPAFEDLSFRFLLKKQI